MARPISSISFLCSFALLSGWFASLPQPALAQDSYAKPRLRMVEERVEKEGVTNEAVLRALREVPRHLFVDPKYYADAYREVIIDIGYKQTLSTAYIVGWMTAQLDPKPTDKVLEIGTGSGYQAAVFSRIAKEVYSIEIVEPLALEAKERLQKLGYTNVKTKAGDGFLGWPEYAPFDKIIVTCSPEKVPQPLIDQLAEGGKIIIPLGERYHQWFHLIEKVNGKPVDTKVQPTLFVPMTGKAEQARRKKTDAAHPKIVNGGFEDNLSGIPDGWFYLRQGVIEKKKDAPQGKHYLQFSNTEEGRDAHILQGIGIDGSKVSGVTISLFVRGEGILPGGEPYQKPALAIAFFDKENKLVGQQALGPWLGTFRWNKVSVEAKVPKETQMALLQIGLRGATGKLAIDDVKMVSNRR
jgi:protein-L-isoaspartate(D-aspartate) O-methyltransferase